MLTLLIFSFLLFACSAFAPLNLLSAERPFFHFLCSRWFAFFFVLVLVGWADANELRARPWFQVACNTSSCHTIYLLTRWRAMIARPSIPHLHAFVGHPEFSLQSSSIFPTCSPGLRTLMLYLTLFVVANFLFACLWSVGRSHHVWESPLAVIFSAI